MMVKLTAVVDAMSINPDGTRSSDIDVLFIANLCSNLIVVDQSTESIRFVHLSVVEYLQARVIPDTSPPDKEYSFGHVSTETATSCLSTIAYTANNDNPAIWAITALPHPPKPKRLGEISIEGASKIVESVVQYAVFYWPSYYLHSLEVNGEDEALQRLVNKVMRQDRQNKELEFWINQYGQEADALLHVSSVLNMER